MRTLDISIINLGLVDSEGRFAAWETVRLPHTLSLLGSSTGYDTPVLLHRFMYTEGCRRERFSVWCDHFERDFEFTAMMINIFHSEYFSVRG